MGPKIKSADIDCSDKACQFRKEQIIDKIIIVIPVAYSIVAIKIPKLFNRAFNSHEMILYGNYVLNLKFINS